MRIVQLIPSAGESFYCENCLRDLALVKAMRALGHDVITVPMYLPLRVEGEESGASAPIFFGGVNVYLQQKLALFRKTPRWIDRIFDRPGLLAWASRKAGMTSAKDLGETTVSMLQGEDGRQVKELNRLIDWLRPAENRPEVVCLSNAMLSGLARRIKAELGVAVVCMLQDEDGFLDGLAEPYAGQAWGIIAERTADVDAFIAVSKYYAGVMQERLKIVAERLHTVYMGVATQDYQLPAERPDVPTVGFLSRACYDKGLDTLVEAFIRLKKNEKLRDARLRIAGGQTENDKSLIRSVCRRLAAEGVIDDVEFVGGFGRQERIAFLRSLSVLCVPERKPVAAGLYVFEALAAGVPVVEPENGVFPELLEATGGGAMYAPGDEAALAGALESLLLDGDYAEKIGSQARDVVFAKFDIGQTAKEMVRVFELAMQNLTRG